MLNYNKDLEIKLLENNKDFNCYDTKKSEEMIKTCSLIKEYKNIDQKNKTILENLKNTGLDYEILAESQKLSSLNLRKQYELSIIIFLYLIMNFLTIFEKKVFYKD